MAIYEYDCPGCGDAFEKRVRMAEADRVTCPRCGNKHPARRLSRISVKTNKSSHYSSIPAPASGGL